MRCGFFSSKLYSSLKQGENFTFGEIKVEKLWGGRGLSTVNKINEGGRK